VGKITEPIGRHLFGFAVGGSQHRRKPGRDYDVVLPTHTHISTAIMFGLTTLSNSEVVTILTTCNNIKNSTFHPRSVFGCVLRDYGSNEPSLSETKLTGWFFYNQGGPCFL